MIILMLTGVMIWSCREKYEIAFKTEQNSFLVVEGLINTQGATKINLSRTTPIGEKGISFENNALVEIEGEDNTSYPLLFIDSGRYVSGELLLNEATRYRLSIRTSDSRKYLSSYVLPIKTPEIDTITWTRYQDGIEIYANAKDLVSNTQYYKFEYEETWEFRSYYQTKLITVLKRNPPSVGDIEIGLFDSLGVHFDTSKYYCWQSRISTNIITANTLKLKENQLYAPVVRYPRGAWQFSVLYSMNLTQTGLSKEGYEFFQRMRKNSESLGSIFDGLPSEIKGNIQCVSDTSELVVGFIDASRSKTKRVFIKNSDLKGWNYNQDCHLYPIAPSYQGLFEALWTLRRVPVGESQYIWPVAAEAVCADCTLRGTNIRPSFWPKS